MNFSDIANMYQAAATAQIANVLTEQQRNERAKARRQEFDRRREKQLRSLSSVRDFERENELCISEQWLDEIYVAFDEALEQLKKEPTLIREKARTTKIANFIKGIGLIGLDLVLGILSLVTFGEGGVWLFIVETVIVVLVSYVVIHRYDEAGALSEWELQCEDLITELCAANIMLFAKEFDKSPQQIQYDLASVLMMYPDSKNDWWMSRGTAKVIKEELCRQIELKSNGMKQSSLKVRNLQLQNEGIAIDNVQKKFWRCVSCGNLNRADDMRCPSCGGIRQMEE